MSETMTVDTSETGKFKLLAQWVLRLFVTAWLVMLVAGRFEMGWSWGDAYWVTLVSSFVVELGVRGERVS